MTPNELVEKYLGKNVIVSNKESMVGKVYAILVRPDQYGPLLKIAFGKSGEPVPSLDDVYSEAFDYELSCCPSLTHQVHLSLR